MSVKVLTYNPRIVEWAITRADTDLESLKVKQPLGKIEQWLTKEGAPTLKQLEYFAKTVHIPLGYLFLNEPPKETLPLTFFRSPNNPKKKFSLGLYETVQNIRERQEWLTDYKKDQGHDVLSYIGTASLDDDIRKTAQRLYKILQIPRAWYWELRTREESLAYLIEKIEKAGIFTSFSGVVNGNTHWPIDREEFRGFALVNEYAPFVFVNANDAQSAQIFTLIHEVVHVLVGASAGTDLFQLLPTQDPLEQFCDAVAAEFLVPSYEFLQEWTKTKNFERLSRKFKISTLLLAKKAKDLDLISNEVYLDHYTEVIRKWQELKSSDNKEKTGGNYYYTTVRRVGAQFIRYVESAVKSDQLLYRDAYQMLRMKGDSYNRLVNEYI